MPLVEGLELCEPPSTTFFRRTFWKLDTWEDDSRRRRQLVPNVYGCRHSLASRSSHDAAIVATDGMEQMADAELDQLFKDTARKIVCRLPVPVPITVTMPGRFRENWWGRRSKEAAWNWLTNPIFKSGGRRETRAEISVQVS
jgi:hypothetical protein